jgi:two-component system response regulator YesN
VLSERACEPLFREADLALAVGVSTWSISVRLKGATGRSFPQLVNDRRVERAKELLKSPRLSVKQVAAAVGYPGTSDLDDHFRERVGKTPSEWRKANREG